VGLSHPRVREAHRLFIKKDELRSKGAFFALFIQQIKIFTEQAI
jgi:hypothetical protein